MTEWYEDEFGRIIIERAHCNDDGSRTLTQSSHRTIEEAREYAMRRWGAELED